MVQGLTVWIYDNKGSTGDSLNFCNDYKEALLVGEGVEGIWEPDDKMPTLILDTTPVCGRPYMRAYLAKIVDGEAVSIHPDTWCMFGGTFIHSCDSRFPSKYPIPPHDRAKE